MSAASTHFKLGVLTLLALVAALGVVFGLGWRSVKADTVSYHTYLDETVQGLEIGSPVKYRGVLIGNVSDIQVAPDVKHVDVTLAIQAAEVKRLGLAKVAPELRTQLGTQGITGVKFVDIDFFDPATNPPPKISFRPADNYIPARPSLMKGLEGNLESVSQRVPVLVDTMVVTLKHIDEIVIDLHDQRIPNRLAKTIEDIDCAVLDMRRLLQGLDRARLPEKTATAIENLNVAIAKVSVVLDGVGGDAGLVASTQRAADSIGDLGRSANGSAAELEQTLRDLDEAAVALRELAETLDRDPDILVKGRAVRKKR